MKTGNNQTSTKKSGHLGIRIDGNVRRGGNREGGKTSSETERPEGREFGSPIEERTPIKQTGHEQ